MLQYFEIVSKMSLVSSSSLFVITVIICLLNISQFFWHVCVDDWFPEVIAHTDFNMFVDEWTSANERPV